MKILSKVLSAFFQLAVLGLLCFIAYNTGVGKTFPVNHPEWLSCDGALSQGLFYSTLLEQNDDLKALAKHVKDATTVTDIERLVTNGSSIDAARTEWFESVSEPGRCQAQIFLQTPNKDGNNTAYVGFDVSGFERSGKPFLDRLANNEVLESINVNPLGVKWFKE